MKKRSKKYQEKLKSYDASKSYSIKDAIGLSKKLAFAKFDESIDLAFRLGVDPRHADQMIRGAIALPGGTGKTTRVLVVTSGENLNALYFPDPFTFKLVKRPLYFTLNGQIALSINILTGNSCPLLNFSY